MPHTARERRVRFYAVSRLTPRRDSLRDVARTARGRHVLTLSTQRMEANDLRSVEQKKKDHDRQAAQSVLIVLHAKGGIRKGISCKADTGRASPRAGVIPFEFIVGAPLGDGGGHCAEHALNGRRDGRGGVPVHLYVTCAVSLKVPVLKPPLRRAGRPS